MEQVVARSRHRDGREGDGLPARLVRVRSGPAPRRARAAHTDASRRAGRRGMKRALLALLLLTTSAHSQHVELPKSTAHLILPDDWKATPAPSIVAAYK